MLVGIGGPSRAGKTTLARLLEEALIKCGYSVLVVSQDVHVINEDNLPRIREKADWEVPESIDWASLYGVIKTNLDLVDFVIVEGLFCFNNEKIDKLMTHRIFININKDLFVHRKKEDLRWGSQPEPNWYIEHIWKSYQSYGIPDNSKSYYHVSGGKFFDIETITKYVTGDTSVEDTL